jgi:hypothetical protein
VSDFGEAIGTAVEGGLFARAMDGRSKSETPLEKGHFAEGTCLNCGTELIGSHCHQCGQKAHLHRTIGAFMHDLLHGALHFEGKTWRTLPKLFFKPGELTKRYIEGERARFVSPMALFLFSIFLMFAVFQIAGISTPTDLRGDSPVEVRNSIDRVKVETGEALRKSKAELAAMPADDPGRAELEAEIAEAEEAYQAIETTQSYALGKSIGASMKEGTGIAWFDKGLEKWRSNPTLMLYKLQTNFYKFSWMLIPLSIPFVWLLFAWKRRFRAYDHAIFVTYSIAFMSLLILTVTMLAQFGVAEAIWGSLLSFVPPIHIYKHLRHAYGLSRFSAFWRLMVLSVFISIVLVLFLQLLLVIGAF